MRPEVKCEEWLWKWDGELVKSGVNPTEFVQQRGNWRVEKERGKPIDVTSNQMVD